MKFGIKTYIDNTNSHTSEELTDLRKGNTYQIVIPNTVNFYRIHKVLFKNYSNSFKHINYHRIGNTLYVNNCGDGEYIVEYHQRIRLLTNIDLNGTQHEEGTITEDTSLDLNTLGLTDEICTAVIPYFVKANLWQEIEPELAQLSKNQGLQNISYIDVDDEPFQENVESSWGGYYE